MLQVAERTITSDLENLIKAAVDPKKADYAVVTGAHCTLVLEPCAVSSEQQLYSDQSNPLACPQIQSKDTVASPVKPEENRACSDLRSLSFMAAALVIPGNFGVECTVLLELQASDICSQCQR